MVSAIVPSLPADGVPAVKADLRSNLAAAKSEIEALQAQTAAFPTAALNGMRNRIINGEFLFAQRGVSTAIPNTGVVTFGPDRWWAVTAAGGALYTLNNASTGTPAIEHLSFGNVTVTTNKAALAAGDSHTLCQSIEGYNCGDFFWGAVGAKSVVLSFWVLSTIAGSYAIRLDNGVASPYQSYVAQYTVSSANVWEYKSVVVPGPTSGTWVGNSSAAYVRILYDLGSGTTFSGPANAWSGSVYNTFTGATKLVSVASAQLNITGVQLEVGTAATHWDYRIGAFEFALCQRYYQQVATSARFNATGAAQALSVPTTFPVSMRAGPTSVFAAGGSTLNLSATDTYVPTSALGGRHEIISGSAGDTYALSRLVNLTAELT